MYHFKDYLLCRDITYPYYAVQRKYYSPSYLSKQPKSFVYLGKSIISRITNTAFWVRQRFFKPYESTLINSIIELIQ